MSSQPERTLPAETRFINTLEPVSTLAQLLEHQERAALMARIRLLELSLLLQEQGGNA